MKLSTRTRYGMRAIIELAQHEGKKPLQLKAIADRQDISVKYLEQLMSTLRSAGFVRSVRGSKGGYILARPADEVKLERRFPLSGRAGVYDRMYRGRGLLRAVGGLRRPGTVDGGGGRHSRGPELHDAGRHGQEGEGTYIGIPDLRFGRRLWGRCLRISRRWWDGRRWFGSTSWARARRGFWPSSSPRIPAPASRIALPST